MCISVPPDLAPAEPALANLLAADAAARKGEPLPPEVASWFAAAVGRYLAGEEDIGRALGLAGGQGHRKACTLWRLAARNVHLRQACTLLEGGPKSQTVQLAAAVRKFASRTWPRWREFAEPPPGSSALQRCLFDAHRLAPLPESLNALRAICNRTSKDPYSVRRQAPMLDLPLG